MKAQLACLLQPQRATPSQYTHLSATLPRCARELTANLVFCSCPFQLQMQASQPHFQLELCKPQLGELLWENLPSSVVWYFTVYNCKFLY
jgi:hypothetical protein